MADEKENIVSAPKVDLNGADIAQARLVAIVESSDDAIISKTLGGIITSWNRSAERLFGYTAEEAIGQSILLIVPSDRRGEEATIISRLRKGERIDHFETQRQTKDGHLIEISLTVSPIRNAAGIIVGASKVARDISEKKRTDERRERFLEAERHAREEAQRLNRMKDEFLATLSHELRTPLNAVMGWAQMLAAGRMNLDEMKEAGQIIERNARMQKQLIDDLLDMSRIISGKLRLEMRRVEPATVIESVLETIGPSADAKSIHIEKSLDPVAGPISGDPARLQQVLWNLFSNAIKFTPIGGRIDVRLASVNSHIELTVSDTGQGIAPEFLPQLFARFSQADSSTNRRYGGLGLGLAITKQLVELHGGQISANSRGKGMGATFTISLPRMIKQSGEEPHEIFSDSLDLPLSEPFEADLSRLKVLVVDDEPDARNLIRRLLSESGAQVFTADSAAEALRLLEQDVPDILVSDIAMPDVDGYELLRRVRELDSAAAQIPAIALTAFARSEDRTRALRAGYIAHVTKPVEPSELLATIAAISGRTSQVK
jgi:PAS domain S-box-containing protein